MTAAPSFPPLFRGQEDADPLAAARRLAAAGCDGGTVLYSFAGGDLSAALVLAPEVPLAEAAEMLVVAGLGLQNALGALAPPEVAIHLEADGTIRVNGGRAGRIGVHAPGRDPATVPDWLIVTLDIAFLPAGDNAGATPDRTALYAEGCGELAPPALLEAWIRHSLLWISRWMDGERTALHRDHAGLLHGLGGPVELADQGGELVAVERDFSYSIQQGGRTVSVPLHVLVRP